MPGMDRAVTNVSAATERPVAYAIVDVPRDLNGGTWYVFVLDNLRYERGYSDQVAT